MFIFKMEDNRETILCKYSLSLSFFIYLLLLFLFLFHLIILSYFLSLPNTRWLILQSRKVFCVLKGSTSSVLKGHFHQMSRPNVRRPLHQAFHTDISAFSLTFISIIHFYFFTHLHFPNSYEVFVFFYCFSLANSFQAYLHVSHSLCFWLSISFLSRNKMTHSLLTF